MVASDEDLPRAYLARVPFPAGGQVSGVLIPRSMEFLAVRLLLDGYPLIGRNVAFFECTDDEEKGDALGEPVLSDRDGIARLPRVVPVGHYLCEVDRHDPTVVTTVSRLDEAAPVLLPIGSEAIDHDGCISFDVDESEESGSVGESEDEDILSTEAEA
jgi:hypothetical protein